MKRLRALLNRKGQSAVEYILILSVLVAIILIVSKYLPDKFKGFIDTVTGRVTEGINSASKPSGG